VNARAALVSLVFWLRMVVTSSLIGSSRGFQRGFP